MSDDVKKALEVLEYTQEDVTEASIGALIAAARVANTMLGKLQDRITKALSEAADVSDGSQHKQYAIDQMVRALTGCPIRNEPKKLPNGHEYTIQVQEESLEYKDWVAEYQGEWDGEYGFYHYDWDVGIAP